MLLHAYFTPFPLSECALYLSSYQPLANKKNTSLFLLFNSEYRIYWNIAKRIQAWNFRSYLTRHCLVWRKIGTFSRKFYNRQFKHGFIIEIHVSYFSWRNNHFDEIRGHLAILPFHSAQTRAFGLLGVHFGRKSIRFEVELLDMPNLHRVCQIWWN